MSKIIIALSASICKKISIYKGFHSLRLFDNTNSNTIFYIIPYFPPSAKTSILFDGRLFYHPFKLYSFFTSPLFICPVFLYNQVVLVPISWGVCQEVCYDPKIQASAFGETDICQFRQCQCPIAAHYPMSDALPESGAAEAKSGLHHQ